MTEHINKRINRGKQITAEAIKNNTPELLKKCIAQFIKIKTPVEEIQNILNECPIDLFAKTGYCIIIETPLSDKPITFGKDITWDALKELVRIKPKQKDIQTIIESAKLLDGQIEKVISNSNSN